MFEMFLHSVSLFLQGKLFQDIHKVFRQAGIGISVGAILLIVSVKAGLALWIAVLLSSLISGALQPWLFKDLKYR
ncbi:MAG: hypothetical protein RLT87_11225 [Gammaproteobacteria bacterium]